MAVNIDNVYQKVLAIVNKEQRGYITPQEFNLFANQAQMSIFEQYFYDVNQFDRLPNNNTTYSDMVPLLEEKISIFKKRHQPIVITSAFGDGTLPTDMYRLGTVLRYALQNVADSQTAEIQLITEDQLIYYNASPLAAPSVQRPVYLRTGANSIKIYPNSSTPSNSTAVFFQQTGKSQYNGQNNQFNAGGFILAPSVSQASASATVYTQALPTDQIKVGQKVTGTSIITSTATTVKSFIDGATTTLGVGGVSNGSKEFTIVAPSSGNGTVAIGQNLPDPLFPTGTTVVGIQGLSVYASLPAAADLSAGSGILFLGTLVLSQLPSAALTTSNELTFNENATSYIEIGQSVTGSGVPASATVSSVNGTVITLSGDFSTGGYKTLTFASDDVICNYIKKPIDVSWGYTTVNSVALYNSDLSTDFELHTSEENQLVIKILALVGIAIKDPNIYQTAISEENRTIQQEKQ